VTRQDSLYLPGYPPVPPSIDAESLHTDATLSPDELLSIFNSQILPRYQGSPRRHPVALFVVGQPGAGKSTVERPLAAQLGIPGAVSADTDDLYAYHPMYEHLARQGEARALTACDSSVLAWSSMAVGHVMRSRSDVIMPMFPRMDDAEVLRWWQRASYRVEVAFIAVDDVLSKQGVLSRLLTARERAGYGRQADYDMDSRIYDGILDIADLTDHGYADAVHLVRRGGNIVYSRHRENYPSRATPPTRQIIATERHRPWAPSEASAFRRTQDEIRRLACISTPSEIRLANYISERARAERLPACVPPAANIVPVPTDRVRSSRPHAAVGTTALAPRSGDTHSLYLPALCGNMAFHGSIDRYYGDRDCSVQRFREFLPRCVTSDGKNSFDQHGRPLPAIK
jgi:UDP-N-acetylglucosamine kinase